MGTYFYSDAAHLHAVTAASSGYGAIYDTAGNMTCRQVDFSTTCSGTPTGQKLSYDSEGRLSAWQNTQSSPTQTANYLYDGEGTRVALLTTQSGTSTTTIYVGDLEEITTSGATTTKTTYYYAGQMRVALAVNGIFTYLGDDRLGSTTVALDAAGNATASQLYAPFGGSRYASGTMPTDYGFTGQHGDSITGLDYYVSRYYDPVVGQFTSADSTLPENGYNPWGLSRYAYVQGNPETMTDPDGHCWPLCTIIAGALLGAAIGAATSIVTQAASGKGVHLDQVAKDAAVGAISGAVSGLAGPEAGIAAHAAVGAAAGAIGQVATNALTGKPLGDGVLQAALVGGITGGAMRGAGKLFSKFAGKAAKAADQVGAVCGGLSFASGTPVATPSGKKAIQDLQVGDLVQAFDPNTETVKAQTVDAVFVNHDSDLLDVTLVKDASARVSDAKVSIKHEPISTQDKPNASSDTVHTTFNHPWLTVDRGWVDAGNLNVGEQVRRLDGSTATVVHIHLMPGEADMYDLTIHSIHTFVVGELQIVVHNTCDST